MRQLELQWMRLKSEKQLAISEFDGGVVCRVLIGGVDLWNYPRNPTAVYKVVWISLLVCVFLLVVAGGEQKLAVMPL